MLKVLLTGSVKFEDRKFIKDFIFGLKNKYQDNIKVATLNEKFGADKHIKKYAIEFGLDYGEFNRYDQEHKLYDIMPEWLFGKPYNYRNKIY